MAMTDDQATDILTALIEPVLDQGFSPDVLEYAIWMELEAKLGPLVRDAFFVDVDLDENTLAVGPHDRFLAEKLLKRYLPAGDA